MGACKSSSIVCRACASWKGGATIATRIVIATVGAEFAHVGLSRDVHFQRG